MSDDEIEFVPHPDSKVRKALTVLDLRVSGYQFDQIAEILNLSSEQEAIEIFERGAAKHLKTDPQAIDRLRHLTNRRLEQLLRAVMGKALNPKHPEQLAAHARALAVIDRYAKLYGLDAATKLDVEITPTAKEMADFVASMMALNSEIPEEADIFDAEIVEGDFGDGRQELGA